MAERKKQIRFTENDDIKLLKEVLAKNPYKDKSKWTDISETVSRGGFTVDSRRARERTQLLTDQHKKTDAENRKKSGVSEVYSEKCNLLDDICQLKEEEDKLKEERKDKILETEKERIRYEENDATPTKKRASTTNVIEYLQQKSGQENDFRKDELELRRDELKLEREKFELEKEERKKRLEIESREKTMMLELLQKLVNQK